ncbi:hypothetical protein M9H77_22342 [Catharanthus roseus]|uniref:Uncharacterized protein n=1 Tax=Catharanthus roseus TaxID=4058 RepID=A0ACC0AR48_CATRO|nr:hypothetical protein M9H77_22342 [Catharanthus roseus]
MKQAIDSKHTKTKADGTQNLKVVEEVTSLRGKMKSLSPNGEREKWQVSQISHKRYLGWPSGIC